jgi:hypothetical protein
VLILIGDTHIWGAENPYSGVLILTGDTHIWGTDSKSYDANASGGVFKGTGVFKEFEAMANRSWCCVFVSN